MFEIIKNLPLPVKGRGQRNGRRANKYPFEEMDLGDCLSFNAESQKDPVYKKIYGSAMSYARRVKRGYKFVFGKIEEGKFGCWKVATESEEREIVVDNGIRNRKRRSETIHITKEMLISALENEGTINGASRILNISTRTISRLKQKFEI